MISMADLGMRSAELRASETLPLRASHPAFRIPHSALALRTGPPSRAGFTLIELLVTILIIGVLATLLLGVAARAGESGREARTKAMIARLNTLVMEQYETYKFRRAPLSTAFENAKGVARAEARLYALRELMILEMPDRWSDVVLAPVDDDSSTPLTVPPVYLKSPTSASNFGGPTPLNEAFRRQYFSMVNAGVSAEDIKRFQGAECLYMVVMIATADGEARSLFSENSIGDTDGDGAYEFLDGWGRPIDFFRWAPGFESDRQFSSIELGDPTVDPTPWQAAAREDHDPLDLFRVEQIAIRLVPLIYSAGPDETYSLFNASEFVPWINASAPVSNQLSNRIVSPFVPYNVSAGNIFIGTPLNEADQIDARAGADNITNHNLTGE